MLKMNLVGSCISDLIFAYLRIFVHGRKKERSTEWAIPDKLCPPPDR